MTLASLSDKARRTPRRVMPDPRARTLTPACEDFSATSDSAVASIVLETSHHQLERKLVRRQKPIGNRYLFQAKRIIASAHRPAVRRKAATKTELVDYYVIGRLHVF